MPSEIFGDRMNAHEKEAWRELLSLGARPVDFGSAPGLDLRGIRHYIGKGERQWSDMLGALREVVGRSGANRIHVDRRGNGVFVVTDDAATAQELARDASRYPVTVRVKASVQ